MPDHNNTQVDYSIYRCPVCSRNLSWYHQYPYCSEHGYLYSQPLASVGQDGTLEYPFADNQTSGPQRSCRSNFGVFGQDDVEESHVQNAHQDGDGTTAHERLSAHPGVTVHDDAEGTARTCPPSETGGVAGSWPSSTESVSYAARGSASDYGTNEPGYFPVADDGPDQGSCEDMIEVYLQNQSSPGMGGRDTRVADDAMSYFHDNERWPSNYFQSYSNELILSDDEEASSHQAPQ